MKIRAAVFGVIFFYSWFAQAISDRYNKYQNQFAVEEFNPLQARNAPQDFSSIRDMFNEVSYNMIIGNCAAISPQWTPKMRGDFGSYLNQQGYCVENKPPGPEVTLSEFTSDAKETIFFDAVAMSEAKNNQCKMDYWSALSTDGHWSTKSINEADRSLMKDHPGLKGLLTSNLKLPIDGQSARAAQRKILENMINAGIRMETKERKIRELETQKTHADEIRKLAYEIDAEEATYSLSEDPQARAFFEKTVLPMIQWNLETGGELDPEKLTMQLLDDPKNSFQKQVVEKKMEAIAKSQKDIADTHGDYRTQHSFKVEAFEKGFAEQLIFGYGPDGSQAQPFAEMSCELNSKYGLGSEIAATNFEIAMTVGSYGARGLLPLASKLVSMNKIPASAERFYAMVLAGKMSKVSIGELVISGFQGCLTGTHTELPSYSVCSTSAAVKASGILPIVEKGVESSHCLKMFALSALGSFVGSKALSSIKNLNEIEKAVGK